MLMTQMLQELVSACQQLAAEKEGYEKDVTTHEDLRRIDSDLQAKRLKQPYFKPLISTVTTLS